VFLVTVLELLKTANEEVLNARGKHGLSILHFAVQSPNEKILIALLSVRTCFFHFIHLSDESKELTCHLFETLREKKFLSMSQTKIWKHHFITSVR
jgi:hypothetical protein